MRMPKLNKDAVLVGLLFLIFYPLGVFIDNWLLSNGIYPYMIDQRKNSSVGVIIAVVLALIAHVIIQKKKKK